MRGLQVVQCVGPASDLWDNVVYVDRGDESMQPSSRRGERRALTPSDSIADALYHLSYIGVLPWPSKRARGGSRTRGLPLTRRLLCQAELPGHTRPSCANPAGLRAGGRSRTGDHLLTREALCQLSYSGSCWLVEVEEAEGFEPPDP